MFTDKDLDDQFSSTTAACREALQIHRDALDEDRNIAGFTRLLCILTEQQTSVLHGIYAELVERRHREARQETSTAGLGPTLNAARKS